MLQITIVKGTKLATEKMVPGHAPECVLRKLVVHEYHVEEG